MNSQTYIKMGENCGLKKQTVMTLNAWHLPFSTKLSPIRELQAHELSITYAIDVAGHQIDNDSRRLLNDTPECIFLRKVYTKTGDRKLCGFLIQTDVYRDYLSCREISEDIQVRTSLIISSQDSQASRCTKNWAPSRK